MMLDKNEPIISDETNIFNVMTKHFVNVTMKIKFK